MVGLAKLGLEFCERHIIIIISEIMPARQSDQAAPVGHRLIRFPATSPRPGQFKSGATAALELGAAPESAVAHQPTSATGGRWRRSAAADDDDDDDDDLDEIGPKARIEHNRSAPMLILSRIGCGCRDLLRQTIRSPAAPRQGLYMRFAAHPERRRALGRLSLGASSYWLRRTPSGRPVGRPLVGPVAQANLSARRCWRLSSRPTGVPSRAGPGRAAN